MLTLDGEMKMAISTGKAARRRLGNRYACKRSGRHRNPAKIARWNELEKIRLRKEKRGGGE